MPGSNTDAVVDNAGTSQIFDPAAEARDVFIGRDNEGYLEINTGGALSSNRYGYIGYGSGSNGAVTVSGSASSWNNSSHMFVGYYGSAELMIEGGGTVSNSYGYIGFESGSDRTQGN